MIEDVVPRTGYLRDLVKEALNRINSLDTFSYYVFQGMIILLIFVLILLAYSNHKTKGKSKILKVRKKSRSKGLNDVMKVHPKNSFFGSLIASSIAKITSRDKIKMRMRRVVNRVKSLKHEDAQLQKEIDALYKKKVHSVSKRVNILRNEEKQLQKEIIKIMEETNAMDNKKLKVHHDKLRQLTGNSHGDGSMDNEVMKILKMTDHLLGKLPEKEIHKFTRSKDFELYKKVMGKMK